MFQRLLALALAVAPFCTAGAQKLSPLAPEPDWKRLEAYQRTITHEDFQNLLDTVYAPGAPMPRRSRSNPDRALITRRHADPYVLEFSPQQGPKPRSRAPGTRNPALPPATSKQPLAGCGSPSTPVIWAATGRRWRNGGSN